MKKYSWLALLLVVAVCAVLVAGCGGTTTTTAATTTTTGGAEATTTTAATTETTVGEKIVLKYAHFTGGKDFPGRQLDFWAEEIEKQTNGQVEVRKFLGGTLLTAKNMFDGILEGVADVGISFVTYEPGRFPLLSLNDLPGLGYANSAQGSQAFFDVVWAHQDLDELKDFQIITAFCTEPAHIQTINKYETLESLKGAQIRTAGGPKVLEALGAVGVGMPQSEIAQALQTNVIQGIMTSREVLLDFKYAEKIKYVLNKPLGNVSAIVVMRKDKFEALPDNVKKVILDLAPQAAKVAGTALDQSVKESLEWAISTEGVSEVDLSPEEDKKFDDAIAPVIEKWLADVEAKGLPAREFYKKLQDAGLKYK